VTSDPGARAGAGAQPDAPGSTEPTDAPGPADEGIGPLPEGGYPVPQPPTDAGTTRERWVWTGIVVGVGLLIFGLMIFGGAGGLKPELQQISVSDVLTSRLVPSERFGNHEVQIVGWYVALYDGCVGDSGGTNASVAWLQRSCPLRVLLPTQPTGAVSQAEMLQEGLRLAAPDGKPFPPPTPVGGGTASLEQLVFVGHFDDPVSGACDSGRVALCRNTFVVTGYTGLLR
jgi:hypothetical protein